MDEFLQTIFSYPVNVYSILFIVVFIYWVVCVVGGFVDFGADADADVDVDVDMDADIPDAGADMDADADVDMDAGAGNTGLLAGILFKFGLHGIPMTIIVSLIVIFGWFFSSVLMGFLLPLMPSGAMYYVAGTGVLIGCLIAGSWVAGRLISPIRNFLSRRKEDTSSKSLCGRPVTVRSGTVTEKGGQAVCVKDGYTFILHVQTLPGEPELKNGDAAYILSYHRADNTYTIVSEEKFKGA